MNIRDYVDMNKPLSDFYSELYSKYQTANTAGDTAKVRRIERQADSLQKEMTNFRRIL